MMIQAINQIPVWVLNLQRDHERRAFMQEQLNVLNVTYEIIAGVDGKTLSKQDLSHYSQQAAIYSCGRRLGFGEIGCALSHARIWERIVKEGIEEVLVLEDDVEINPLLFKILERKSKFPKDYEFINFLTDVRQQPFGPFVFDGYRFSRHQEYANRACLYLVTRKGATKLLNNAYPIRWAADGLTGRTYLTNLISYGMYPNVAVLSDFESTIWKYENVPPKHLIGSVYTSLKEIFKR